MAEPAFALEQRDQEMYEPVGQHDAGKDQRVGGRERDDLEPGEGEESRDGGQVSEAGETEGTRAAEGAPGEADGTGPGLDGPPDVAEEHGEDGQADPEQGPDREGQEVGQRIAAAEKTDCDQREKDEAG